MKRKDDIYAYIAGDTRNKIIISDSCVLGLHYIDVGYELANFINQNQQISYDPTGLLQQILKVRKYDETIGSYLALKNIGILFEPSLHFNLRAIIDKYSVEQALFICANGHIEANRFLFIDENAFYIDLQGLSYKYLKNWEHEIQ